MDDYDDLQLPVYRYETADQEDGFEIHSDYEDAPSTAPYVQPSSHFQDLLGLDPVDPPAPPALDDQPVKGAGKTFEQLVEEQMRAENPTAVTQRKITQKREFLRKNSGGNKVKPTPTVEKKPVLQEILPPEEEEVMQMQITNKPKQTFLKRGEGKMCARPPSQPEPPPPSKPTAKPSSVPTKSAPKPSAVKPVTTPSSRPEAKRPVLPPTLPPEPPEDEIEINREELVLTEAVTAVRPRLKEKTPPVVEEVTGIQAKMKELILNLEKIKTENKSENAKLMEKERKLREINQEIEVWQDEKESRKTAIFHWKDDEIRKIKSEKRLSESKLPLPPKKDSSEELDELKSVISSLQDALTIKENKRKSTLDRLKSQLMTANTENRLLETELKELERRRVNEGWTRGKGGKKGSRF